MNETGRLRRSFILALLALLAALVVAGSATFAWYLFTLRAHTTRLHMAAGSNVSLQLGNRAEGPFGSSVALEKFQGRLTPVSTDCIRNGFQKVAGFEAIGRDGSLLATLFSPSREQELEYYKTTLYFRTDAEALQVYLSDIGFLDSSETVPISSAIRVGFVFPATGGEAVFAISDRKNPLARYNTAHGAEGSVLDSTRRDGWTRVFTPYDRTNFCDYDEATGVATRRERSVPLCTVRGGAADYGAPVEMEVYIWLEGCDEDCTENLGSGSLSEIALHFVGLEESAV